MAIRKAAVVTAIAIGAALAVSGTTNASPDENCATTSVQSMSDTECTEYEFASSDEEWDKDKHHDKDWEHHDKDWDKDKHHHKDWGHHDKDRHHHKKQIHKKPHGGVETGDGSLAALL
ncbi:hypothetical protein [Saccharomonospora xinjiangensis]|uniref:Pentapeptide MXKDX repeat protein n=1 Tax=Saccharomonospora xinjiangensis XJ-54 TaxID=882086 RepID=I0UYF7_9PSEU|nr:hypothetical protein [Saccharomonospora xinjiangensis]EID52910.1 hypothetical protein SacxiDRAFT_0638 [Saccharomonospora xinjiangensis XJ-54]